jgi:photosystem II stability/assembly factor-like uncharacterized protein
MRALSSLTALLFLLLAAPAGAALSTNHSGWLWGAPEPQGNNLFGLEMQDSTGYAAGEFGTLLRTNDGGATWGTVRTGQTLDFNRLDMIDSDSIVVASECAARRTDDAGDSFRRLPFTGSEARCNRRLRSISFPTADIGYLLLDDGRILKTTDGGRSFSPQPITSDEGVVPTALMFSDPNDGIAATSTGEIYRTIDGGDDWTREFDGSVALNGVFYTDDHAMAVGQGGMFLSSDDGGDSWTQPADQPGVPDPPPFDFVGVRCGSTPTCLVITGPGEIFRTPDAGRTFAPTGGRGNAAEYASDTRAIAVGMAGRTLLSDNGGTSFTTLGARLDEVPQFIRVRATSASVAHVTGWVGGLARTVDGGETWENVGVATSEDVRDVSFPNASVGYALDLGGGLFRTENGGSSWSILETTASELPNAIYAPNGSDVFLIGPRGVVRSTDSGETFEPHEHRIIRNRTLTDVDKAGSAVIFFGPRVVAVSTDDGDTWRRIPRPTKRAEIASADFVSARVGYVLVENGRLYFTRNAGERWRELVGTGRVRPGLLAFGDRRHGWISMGEFPGSALRTADGGRSWTPQILGSGLVSSIAAVGDGTGFAVTSAIDSSDILFTQDGGGAGRTTSLTLSTESRRLDRPQRIKVRGRLQPARGGEDIVVWVRRLNGRRWRALEESASGKGRFSFERRVRRSTVFVAQWAGDPVSDGDGSRPLVVQVRR